MRRASALLAILAFCQMGLAQNLLLNPSFQDPAFARLKLKPTVADADWVALDTGGSNRIYEFDTDGNYDPLHIQVYLGTDTGVENAAKKLRDAVNADAGAVATATARNPNDGNYEVYFAWKGYGGDGKVNSSNRDGSGARLEIDNFNEKCRKNYSPVPILDWQGSNTQRDDSIFGSFPCPVGCQYASLTGSGTAPRMIYQTVSGLDSSKKYLLTGRWALGDWPNPATFSAELHNGSDTTGTPLSTAAVTITVVPGGITYRWMPFAVSAQPSGNSMTAVFKVVDTTGNNYGMHLDDVSLIESTCIPPTVTTFAPGIVFTGQTYDDLILVTGSGFVAGQTTVRLRRDDYWNDPANEIAATDVKVDPTGTSLTADLSIATGAVTGYYSVIVEVTGCSGSTLANAFGDAVQVLNGGPFTNGSFELPDPGYNNCPAAPDLSLPTSWTAAESNGFGWQAKLFRDVMSGGIGTLPFNPTCPPPDGWHYAGAWSNAGASGNPQDFIYQTFQVTTGQQYTFSGYFAGSGNNNVEMEMRDGPATAGLLAKATIHRGGGNYDWLFNAVSGIPTNAQGLMTVGWRIYVEGDGPHTTFADNLQVVVCNSPISLAGVSPASALNAGTASITLSGTGFAATPTPQVIISKPGTILNATNVVVQSATQITCNVSLAGVSSGKYDVLVVQGGCIAKLSLATPPVPLFLVVAETFANGGFESPTAPANCGLDTWGLPAGWNTLDELNRDRGVHSPCPTIPNGDHYGSMTTGDGELERAWQTLAVSPGWTYRFAGQFAGGAATAGGQPGSNDVKIKLLNGDETGELIAERIVHSGADAYPWIPAEVSGVARSSVMTIMWEMSETSGDSATHADALVFEATVSCNPVFADADGDNDVDQIDFGVFQRCFTGETPPIPTDPSYCQCFNRDLNSVIDSADYQAFEECSSGPGIPSACGN
jgi:hypothetical protein